MAVVTTAVNVTAWLKSDGFADELSAVADAALFTSKGAAVPLPLDHPLPPVKLAMIV